MGREQSGQPIAYRAGDCGIEDDECGQALGAQMRRVAGGCDDESAGHQTAHRQESRKRQTESNRANGKRPWMRWHLASLDDYGLRHDLGDTELRAEERRVGEECRSPWWPL